jgi:hypothetical protein
MTGDGHEQPMTAPATSMLRTSEGGQFLHNEDGSRKQRAIPRWVLGLAVLLLVSAAAGVFVVVRVAAGNAAEKRDRCAGDVELRDQHRAMWFYAADTLEREFGVADLPPRLRDGVEMILPPLTCDAAGNLIVPPVEIPAD